MLSLQHRYLIESICVDLGEVLTVVIRDQIAADGTLIEETIPTQS